ncbi:MAG: hypothetical protein E7607_06295 [Ruminococcaceae bacterium]|nr:hypothetical protein [Oscillospiraceae bacterium]
MAIIYIRSSSSACSLIKQKEEINNLLKANKILLENVIYIEEISHIFYESKFKTEILDSDICNDTIYTLSIDRISREVEIIQEVFYNLLKRNVKIFCLSSNSFFEEYHLICAKVFQSCSLMEREYLSGVTKSALNKLKDQGIKLGRAPKYDRNELFKKIVEAKNTRNLTYAQIAEIYNVDASTICRIYNQGLKNHGFSEGRKQELKELIKNDLENNLTHQQIIEKHNIPKTFLITLSKEIKLDEEVNSIPLDTKQKIASEANAGISIETLAKKYSSNQAVVKKVIKLMKGGANW